MEHNFILLVNSLYFNDFRHGMVCGMMLVVVHEFFKGDKSKTIR